MHSMTKRRLITFWFLACALLAFSGCGNRLTYKWNEGKLANYQGQYSIKFNLLTPPSDSWHNEKNNSFTVNFGGKQYLQIEKVWKTGDARAQMYWKDVTAEIVSKYNVNLSDIAKEKNATKSTLIVASDGEVKSETYEYPADLYSYELYNVYMPSESLPIIFSLQFPDKTIRPGSKWETTNDRKISFPFPKGVTSIHYTAAYEYKNNGLWKNKKAAFFEYTMTGTISSGESQKITYKSDFSESGRFTFLVYEGMIAESEANRSFAVKATKGSDYGSATSKSQEIMKAETKMSVSLIELDAK